MIRIFNIEIIEKNKSKKLTQWDTDRCIKITAPEGVEVSHADFAHEHDSKAIRREVVLSDGTMMAKIPNSLLQRCGKMRVWLVCDDVTVFGDILVVAQKAKDEGYVLPDDEDDVYSYVSLEKRIRDLEENGTGGGGNGKPGADGFSPIASVEQTADGAEITITDKKGTTKATVKNGKDGKDGYTPQKGIDYFDGKDGADGKDGLNGKDGINGEDGYTPVKGKDYFTDADKQELIQSVFAQVVNGNEVAY